MDSIGKLFGIVFVVVFFLVGITVVFGSWYTVDQTQRAVLLRNGALVEIVQPGLHFKTPWIESVSKVDMQTHTFTWDKMDSYSADQQPANLKVSVTLHVSPDKVGDLYSRFGGDRNAAVQRLIAPHVLQETKVVFGKYTAAKAITERGQFNVDANVAIVGAVSYDPIFVIDSVQIEDIAFSGDYIKSIEQRMQAEVEVQKYQQQLQREKIQADIAVTQAKGRADSNLAEATASAKAVELQGNAQAQAIAARGKALKDNPGVIELTQAERWDGKLPTAMIPGGAVPFLNLGR